MKKEAEKDLKSMKKTRKMRKRQVEQKNNTSSSATDTTVKPESDSVVHVPIAQYVTEETDLLQLLRDNLPVISTKGAGSVNCDSTNKWDDLKESSSSVCSEAQSSSTCTTSANNVNTVRNEQTGDLNLNAQCVFVSSSRTDHIVCTDEPTTSNQDAPTHEYDINSSPENPNTLAESTNKSVVSSDNCSVTDSAIDDNNTESSSRSLMLTGLHTCGNLAPNIFRIFLANPHARVLCNVGCCYQMLTEEFWTEEGSPKGKPA